MSRRVDGRGKVPAGGHIRQIQQKTKRKQIVNQSKLSGWNDSVINSTIPVYKAEEDKYCPKARTRKFNADQKIAAKKNAERGKGASAWLDTALQSKFEDTPIKFTPSLREKAATEVSQRQVEDTNMAEVEILQKVIIRENILAELHKLILNQNDMGNILNEIIELVKAIRFQTVDIMEDVEAWQHIQRVPKPFLYRGQNYVVKLYYDMSFLDRHQMIVDTFGFQFSNNPLMYNKSDLTGNRVSLADRPFGFNEETDRPDWGYGYGAKKLDAVVDGVEVLRLQHVEKLIRREFDRLESEKSMLSSMAGLAPSAPMGHLQGQVQGQLYGKENKNEMSVPMHGVTDAASSIEGLRIGEQSMASLDAGSTGMNGSHTNINADGSSFIIPSDWEKERSPERIMNRLPEKRGTFGLQKKDSTTTVSGKPWKNKISALRAKRERIVQLSEEVENLKAIIAHIEDQTSAKVIQYHDLNAEIKRLTRRRNEALSQARDIAAQHLAVEISMLSLDKQNVNETIKNLQREVYFVELERKRKRGIILKLDSEVNEERKKILLRKKLGKKIQKEGILSALKGLSALERSQSDVLQSRASDSVLLEKWGAEAVLAEPDTDTETETEPTQSARQDKEQEGKAETLNDDEDANEEHDDFFPEHPVSLAAVTASATTTATISASVPDTNPTMNRKDDENLGEVSDDELDESTNRFVYDDVCESHMDTGPTFPGDDAPFMMPSSMTEVSSISAATISFPGEENITTNNIAIGAGTGLAGARGLQQQENEGI